MLSLGKAFFACGRFFMPRTPANGSPNATVPSVMVHADTLSQAEKAAWLEFYVSAGRY